MVDMTQWTKDPELQVQHLTMRFGGLTAIGDLSFDAGRKQITALIGPNGAGKTTVFNCITGFYKPTEGMIKLKHPDGKEFLLERMDDFIITQKAKVARTFQNIRLFSGMTLLENLMVAQHNTLMRASGFTVGGIFGSGHFKRAENSAIEKCKYWLDKVNLTERADDAAGDLPYGAQRRLEIARAMCTDPRLLCLDEPAAGLNPRESDELNKLLISIRDEHNMAILLIEHDMSVVMGISDHIVVLDYGRKIADGTPNDIKNDPAVIRAYLGVEEDENDVAVGNVKVGDLVNEGLAVHAAVQTQPAPKVSAAIKKPVATKSVAKKPAPKKGGRK
jgi:branched-chain amino acid transport system ATP-binding protein